MITQRGYFGLGPASADIVDTLCIMAGSNFPIVLRRPFYFKSLAYQETSTWHNGGEVVNSSWQDIEIRWFAMPPNARDFLWPCYFKQRSRLSKLTIVFCKSKLCLRTVVFALPSGSNHPMEMSVLRLHIHNRLGARLWMHLPLSPRISLQHYLSLIGNCTPIGHPKYAIFTYASEFSALWPTPASLFAGLRRINTPSAQERSFSENSAVFWHLPRIAKN